MIVRIGGEHALKDALGLEIAVVGDYRTRLPSLNLAAYRAGILCRTCCREKDASDCDPPNPHVPFPLSGFVSVKVSRHVHLVVV